MTEALAGDGQASLIFAKGAGGWFAAGRAGLRMFYRMNLATGDTIEGRNIGRSNNFDLIRLVAACAVIVSHVFQVVGYGGIDPLTPYLRGLSLGAVAVIVFFAVSGFFVTQSFARHPSVLRFLAARMLRIFPALAVVLLVTILIGSAITTASGPDYREGALRYFMSNMLL